MNFFNEIVLILGWCVVGMFVVLALTIVETFISIKIKDFKDRKKTIKAGATMYIQGNTVEIKKDLNIRFKKKKITVCECDELKSLDNIKGYCFNNMKDLAYLDFEKKLLHAYVSDKRYMSTIVGEKTTKGE